jgi:prepilin-type N-terminal cleavage/methylation domain-containing protein
MFKNNKSKKNKSFTLIEILVTLAIVVILSGLMFANYPKGGKQLALERASQTLSQDIRRAQEMAMSSVAESGACPGYKTTGYGIFFDESSPFTYIIFRNCNRTSNRYYESGIDQIKETINIESGIKICNLKQGSSDDSDNKISILFEPPDPTTYIEGSSSASDASIILCIQDDTSQQKTIKINIAGSVKIE